MKLLSDAWNGWTTRERRTSAGIWALLVLVLAFLLRDPAIQTAGGAAKAIGLVAFLVGSALSPSFFLSKLNELKDPPRPMLIGFVVFIALATIGSGIELLRSYLKST